MPRLEHALAAPTRRHILTASAVPLLPIEPRPAEPQAFAPATSLCFQWRDLDREAERLVHAWQRLETKLFQLHDWPKLSEAEQRALPAAAPLYAIDARLASVDAQRDLLLASIRRTAAFDLAGVEAKLEVLERIVYREDHPEAHALIRSTRRDVAKLRS